MAKIGTIVSNALRYIKVAPLEQGAPGQYGEVALQQFNTMMTELSASFDLKDTDGAAYTHATQGTNDTLALGDVHADGLAAMLAVRIAPVLAVEENLSIDALSAANRGYGRIAGSFAKSVTQDAGLLRRRTW